MPHIKKQLGNWCIFRSKDRQVGHNIGLCTEYTEYIKLPLAMGSTVKIAWEYYLEHMDYLQNKYK